MDLNAVPFSYSHRADPDTHRYVPLSFPDSQLYTWPGRLRGQRRAVRIGWGESDGSW